MDDKELVPAGNTALVPEPEQTKTPFLEVARLIHEQGEAIAMNLYQASAGQFKDDERVRIVDELGMKIYEGGPGDVANSRRTITVFIGSLPEDPVQREKFYADMGFEDYPRIQFFYRQATPGQWVYNGAQVGVRGQMIGTQRILNVGPGGGIPRFLIDQTVDMQDVERQLGQYLPTP